MSLDFNELQVNKKLERHQTQLEQHDKNLAVLKDRSKRDSARLEKMDRTLDCIRTKSNDNALSIKGISSSVNAAKTVLIIGLSVLGLVVAVVGLAVKFL